MPSSFLDDGHKEVKYRSTNDGDFDDDSSSAREARSKAKRCSKRRRKSSSRDIRKHERRNRKDSRHRSEDNRKRRRRRSRSSDSSSSDESFRNDRHHRSRKRHKHKKRSKSSSFKRRTHNGGVSQEKPMPSVDNLKSNDLHSPSKSTEKPKEVVESAKRRVMVPMSKAEYEKQQSQPIRQVYDPESGRYRLVRGTGEIVESIVSRADHQRINRQATRGDGTSFTRSTLAVAAKRSYQGR